MGSIRLLRLRNKTIVDQIRIEEALFRSNSGSWCILNKSPQPPTIVMGISGKPEELLDTEEVKKDAINILRRFTGGGTVIIDSKTLFVSFIIDGNTELKEVKPYPREIMRWSESFYAPVFSELCKTGFGSAFKLEDTDYVFGQLKFGGNAQAISGKKWVHHTSFLWDYEQKNMRYLKNPKKQPKYRENRDHEDFLYRLKDSMYANNGTEDIFRSIVKCLQSSFNVVNSSRSNYEKYLNMDHRKKTHWVALP